jgi:hypothetical protein
MTVTQAALDTFYQIASERIQNVGVASPEELFDLWKLLNPTSEEQGAIDAAIQCGVNDIRAGRHRAAREVTNELRHKYGVSDE